MTTDQDQAGLHEGLAGLEGGATLETQNHVPAGLFGAGSTPDSLSNILLKRLTSCAALVATLVQSQQSLSKLSSGLECLESKMFHLSLMKLPQFIMYLSSPLREELDHRHFLLFMLL